MATSSVSLSRILGKLNFTGVAYNVEPGTHSAAKSGLGSKLGVSNVSAMQRSHTSAKDRDGTMTGSRSRDEELLNDGWKDQSARIQNRIRAGRRSSTSSDEVQMLGQDSIKWTVDIQQHTERDEGSLASNGTRETRD
jgi:hypothetical protein